MGRQGVPWMRSIVIPFHRAKITRTGRRGLACELPAADMTRCHVGVVVGRCRDHTECQTPGVMIEVIGHSDAPVGR